MPLQVYLGARLRQHCTWCCVHFPTPPFESLYDAHTRGRMAVCCTSTWPFGPFFQGDLFARAASLLPCCRMAQVAYAAVLHHITAMSCVTYSSSGVHAKYKGSDLEGTPLTLITCSGDVHEAHTERPFLRLLPSRLCCVFGAPCRSWCTCV